MFHIPFRTRGGTTPNARSAAPPAPLSHPLNAECKLISTQALGDHTVFTGEALWLRYDPQLQPLLYSAGKYWGMGEQLQKA